MRARNAGSRTWAALVLALLATTACGDRPGEDDTGAADAPARSAGIVVVEAWARAIGEVDATGARRATASYITWTNTGTEPDRLLGVRGDAAAAIEVHRTQVEDGVMRMRRVENGEELAPGDTVEMRPGGLHIMLIGVNRSLHPGDTLQLILELERAGDMPVDVEVRER
jgi:periplasmic copper chaperone A